MLPQPLSPCPLPRLTLARVSACLGLRSPTRPLMVLGEAGGAGAAPVRGRACSLALTKPGLLPPLLGVAPGRLLLGQPLDCTLHNWD